MKPYWERDGITLYHADCREVLPALAAGSVDVCIVDPVWPNASAPLRGCENPQGLFAEAAALLPRLCSRLAVHLGCDTDPRFLLAVPPALPFLRVCWLEYAFPNCKGRILNTGDVAYVFGAPPAARKGRAVIPGRCTSGRVDFKAPGARKWESKQTTRRVATLQHPSPRRLEHVSWLVKWLSDGTVIDPFCGIGTTLLAALDAGYPAIGCEVEERFCEAAARRLENRTPPALFAEEK